ncbi:hypothetical protein [Massilia sp. TS11]|uniref:hypothetical protein n=1 Tax=Massilia sp. TS11 TaxID=2908003 RepID=UPI001EDB2383|nr:hypothetical protein [Massilia sp. TS11]MCG2583700.1 hypothetical protein [Massilia sp. TS11]
MSNPASTPDPGFQLPAASAAAASVPAASAPAALEVAPATPVVRDTSARDLALGSTVFVVLLVVYFFIRNAFANHLVVRRVSPASAGSAAWLLFTGLAFLSAAATLAAINASKYLSLAVTGPLVLVGAVALVAVFFVGRR